MQQQEKKLSSTQDLSRVDRSYLKEHGLSDREFDTMHPVQQREWKEECKIGAYEKSRNRFLKKAQSRKYY